MSGKPMTVQERIRKNMAARAHEKQTQEVPKTKEILKAPTIKSPIHKSQSKSKFPFDKVDIQTIVSIPDKYPDGTDVESVLKEFNVSKSQYRKENGRIKIMDQMTYHKFMNDYHEFMLSPPQSSKPTSSPHENKSEPIVKKEKPDTKEKTLSFSQRKKIKEVCGSEYYNQFKEVMKEQYINNNENCKKYEFPYKVDNFEDEYAFFLEYKEKMEAEGEGDGEEGEGDGEEGEGEGEDGPDEPDVQEEEGEEEDYQSKYLQEIIEQDDDELSEIFNEDTLKIPGLKESFLEYMKENEVDEFSEIQEIGLCDSAGCELFRKYCKDNM